MTRERRSEGKGREEGSRSTRQNKHLETFLCFYKLYFLPIFFPNFYVVSAQNNRRRNPRYVSCYCESQTWDLCEKSQDSFSQRITCIDVCEHGVKVEICSKWRNIKSCCLWLWTNSQFSVIYWRNSPRIRLRAFPVVRKTYKPSNRHACRRMCSVCD